jgi:hypothetical protein
LQVWPAAGGNAVLSHAQLRPNPGAPRIDPQTGAIGNAVVFLRGVDPGRSRPWDHPPVRVELRDCQLHVVQGAADETVGFVRQGDAVELVSRDPWFHSLHAGAAAFFTLAFPDAEAPLRRCLRERGEVELTSEAGYYWMRAHLFVDDHPYYARTDREGHFELAGVPPGRQELVCWLPNWVEARRDRDPETGLVTRLTFKPSLQRVLQVVLDPRQTQEVKITFAAEETSAPAPRPVSAGPAQRADQGAANRQSR